MSRALTSTTSGHGDGRLTGTASYPRERWIWFEQLWTDVCMLHDRYRLPVRSGWWEHQLQVEALAALGSGALLAHVLA